MPFATDRNASFEATRSHAAAMWRAHQSQAAEENSSTGSFHILFQKHDTLERLIADAGPLGKFKTDQPGQMPSGTGALTTRVGDALNRIAAHLGLPVERILPANPSLAPALRQAAAVEILPGHDASTPQPGQQLQSARPAVATETDNRATAHDRGNRASGNA